MCWLSTPARERFVWRTDVEAVWKTTEMTLRAGLTCRMLRFGPLPALPRASGIAILLALGVMVHAQPPVAQPLEPLVAHPIEVSELTSASATLRVTTAVDLACVGVFGLDESFGALALDLDMGDAAHRDHEVVMRGLDPDTEYVFRMQGSAPDGSFYASEVYAFRTPPAEADEDRGWRNVATTEAGARVVEASSEFGSAFTAEHAIDGDPTSEWSSRGDGDGAYLTIELRERVAFAGFGVWSRTMGTSAEIVRFEVETDAGEVFGPLELPSARESFPFEAHGEARRFTLHVLESTGGNTGLVEFAVFVEDGP